MGRKKLVRLSVALIILISAGFFLIKPVLSRLSDFLSKSEKVDGNLLIIEGWLSFDDLNAALEEFRNGGYQYIVTTGLKSTPEYYNVFTDGYLIFYPDIPASPEEKGIHIIEVKAYSELEGENSAHFNVWVNDSLVADFYGDRRKRKYAVQWNRNLSSIDSVMIQFDNDLAGEFGDRNLFVKEIIFDKNKEVPFLNHSVYDISKLDNRNRIVNNMKSNAEMTEKRLLSMGIDSSVIIAIPGQKVRINRTLTSVLAFRDWLKTSDIQVSGINIVSIGTHARRTWMTFNRVLDNSCKIGIISLPDHKHNSDDLSVVKTIRETIAFIYYWFILIPY